jgi:hypothetical protein
MTKKCGSEWWAKELIHLSRDGRDLYRLAVASAREAASRGAAAQGKHLVNIDIDALGL